MRGTDGVPRGVPDHAPCLTCGKLKQDHHIATGMCPDLGVPVGSTFDAEGPCPIEMLVYDVPYPCTLKRGHEGSHKIQPPIDGNINGMPAYNCPACFKGPRGLVTSVDITREEVFQSALKMGPWEVTTVQEVGGTIQMLLLTCDQCGYQTHCEPFSKGVRSVSGSTKTYHHEHTDDGCGSIGCCDITHHLTHRIKCQTCDKDMSL